MSGMSSGVFPGQTKKFTFYFLCIRNKNGFQVVMCRTFTQANGSLANPGFLALGERSLPRLVWANVRRTVRRTFAGVFGEPLGEHVRRTVLPYVRLVCSP